MDEQLHFLCRITKSMVLNKRLDILSFSNERMLSDDSSSFSARTFYRKRINPTRIESLIANVSCGSDSESDELDDDIEDPNYLLHISDVSDESEPVPMLSEITEDPPEVQGKAKQNKKPAINRPYWDKVSARDTTPSISPFLMQYEEDFEQRLPMEYFKFYF